MTTGFGFCATCGAPRRSADGKFCAGCGAAFSSAAPPPPLETAPVVPAPPIAPAPPIVPPPPMAPLAETPTPYAPPFAPPPIVPPPTYAMPPSPQYPPAFIPPVVPPPPGPQYPPAYGAPSPSYTGQPGFAASGVGAATGAGTGILRGILMLPVTLATHLLGRILISLFTMVMIAALITSYLGVVQVPGLSAAFGMDRPRDLHMVKDSAALEALCSKWGIDKPSPTQNYTLSSPHHYSGSVQIDDTISEGAIAARPEFSAPNDNFRQVQFRIHEGSIEMSALVNVPGYPVSGPVYTQFSVSVTSPRTVALDFSELDFGRIGVPGNVVETVKTRVDEYVNQRLFEMGVTIDTLELHEGAIRFKGTWPKTITADPPQP